MKSYASSSLLSVLFLGTITGAIAGQILETSSFSTCLSNSPVTVTKLDIQYNNDNKTVSFNVAGSSSKSMNVTATLNVTAYGNSVYTNSFNPCDAATFVKQLCPVPAGSFSASGTQAIPEAYASLVPAIAFQIPDISAQATLELKALDGGESIACITSQVSNGKTVSVSAVSYVAVGVAGAAVVLTGVSAFGAAVAGGGGSVGAGSSSVSATTIFGWFQGIAMNGMMSVNYPTIYRSFSKNFAFSTGIIPITGVQTAIDNFRARTGGNLTQDNVQFLQNATLVFGDGSASNTTVTRRDELLHLMVRQITTSVNSTSLPANATVAEKIQVKVSGISAYVEALAVPQANSFMTVLIIVGIIIAAIVVGILLFKLILELWALFGNFPESLKGFRKHYWGTMARTIVQLILVLYGVFVLYCIFQFTHGDSWAAKALAGTVLGIFTAVLIFFTFKIWHTARMSKEQEGDTSLLYEDKDTWIKYRIFYDVYRRNYWWTFVPAIVYMFAKGIVLAAADGHGLTQTIAQLVIEGLMCILLIFTRPYELRSGNIINIVIQVVRVLSVVCILVFVEELGIAQTTQTVTGFVLIIVQSVLTGVLAILIAVNAIIACCKENPHRKRRKEAEKLNRDLDNLTPLDARNSLLTGPGSLKPSMTNFSLNSVGTHVRNASNTSYSSTHKDGAEMKNMYGASPPQQEPRLPLLNTTVPRSPLDFSGTSPPNAYGNGQGRLVTPGSGPYRPFTPTGRPITPSGRPYTPNGQYPYQSNENVGLVQGAAPMASGRIDQSRAGGRAIPNLPGYGGYRGLAY